MISVFVPALNKENFVKQTVLNIFDAAKSSGNILVDIIINDGSTDRTKEIVDQLAREFTSLQVRHYNEARGVGNRFRVALQLAKFEKFIIVSGDNDLPKVTLEAMFSTRNRADVIMAYYLNRERRSLFRNIISILFGMVYMCAFNVFVTYLNGPALYPTAKLRELKIRSEDNDLGAELGVKLLRSGCSFYEIASYMRTGLAGSIPLSIKRVLSVIKTFLYLVYEIKIKDKEKYSKIPVRVMGVLGETDH